MEQRAIEEYLQKISQKDFRQTLEPMREVCRLLNNPQENYPTIHIAGTNGKGSAAAFLSSILQAAGLRVGLITSPHLISPTERIQINRQDISWEALSETIQKIQSVLPDEEFLSYFEMMALSGFEYFSKMKVDVAVVEVGMGGRLDATNVVKPKVAVLTPISFDHETYLGNTLSKIAEEKCGILKPGMTVVSAPQSKEAACGVKEKCSQLGIKLIWADPNSVTGPLGLKGNHQKINAACAVEAAKIFLGEEEKVRAICGAALALTSWPGRLQYLRPNMLVDGAHNAAGIQTLADYLKEAHPSQKIYFLVGALKDKNWKTMFNPLIELAKGFYCVTLDSERALPAEILLEHLKSLSPHSPSSPKGTPSGHVHSPSSIPHLPPQDLLVATGSLYMVGEVLKCFPTPGSADSAKRPN